MNYKPNSSVQPTKCVEKEQVNLSEILKIKLLKNLETIKRTKNGVFRF